MGYDDIVIGSGLSALGVVLGLPARRKVLVVGGPASGVLQSYDPRYPVPSAYLGYGGLGNYWHGVIPTGGRRNFGQTTPEDFESLLQRFYPGIDVASRIGKPYLFVPWRPVRPASLWPQLVKDRHVTVVHQKATRFGATASGVDVTTEQGHYRAARVWLCAGALHTPALLNRSLEQSVTRSEVSDHVLCYVGQIDRDRHREVTPASVEQTRHGIWIEAHYNRADTGLFTLKPARFGFKKLDWGIERRAVFGLPTGSVIAKIFRSASVGLIAEAIYNKFGVFPNARVQSVYAQVIVPDAHRLHDGGLLEVQERVIRCATDAARLDCPWVQVERSRHPEIFIPMIHLHHSVDLGSLNRAGLNVPGAAVQIVDASVYDQIGPEHHSFKLMVAAFAKARASQ